MAAICEIPTPLGFHSKTATEKLLNIHVCERSGKIGSKSSAAVQCTSTPEQLMSCKRNAAEVSCAQRLATVEEVDNAIRSNRRKFLITMTVTVMTELFLLAMTIAPFNTAGTARAIAHTLTNATSPWRVTLLVRALYMAILVACSSKAYFSRLASAREWSNVYRVALVGMILEVTATVLVKKLNVVAFVMRGMIALYATTLATMTSSNSAGTKAPLEVSVGNV